MTARADGRGGSPPLALAGGGIGGGRQVLPADAVERAFHEQGVNTFFVTTIHKRKLAAMLAREFDPDVMMIR